MDLNTVVNILIFAITAIGLFSQFAVWALNRRQNKDERRLNDAEKLTSIALNSAETLRKDLADAKVKTIELEGELQKLRKIINDFEDRVLTLEHVYNDLVKRQIEFLSKLNLVQGEIDDIIHGKTTPDDAATLIRERFNIK